MATRKIHPNRAQQPQPVQKGKAKPSLREPEPDEESGLSDGSEELLSRFSVSELRAYIARRDADDARSELTAAAEALPEAVSTLEARASQYLEAWTRVQATPQLADSEEITAIRAAAWDSISGLRWVLSKFGSKRPGDSAPSSSGTPKGSKTEAPEAIDGSDAAAGSAAPEAADLAYKQEILELLKDRPGLRADAIAEAIGCSTKELAPTLKELRSARLVETEGAARGMTYSLP